MFDQEAETMGISGTTVENKSQERKKNEVSQFPTAYPLLIRHRGLISLCLCTLANEGNDASISFPSCPSISLNHANRTPEAVKIYNQVDFSNVYGRE